MFGQQNNQQDGDQQIPDHSIQGALDNNDGVPPLPDQPADDTQAWGHPGTPLDDGSQTVHPTQPVDQPTGDQVGQDAPAAQPADTPQPGQPVNEELIDIKQKALTQLSPLVGHLEQSPEEKFRTTMMMIQASDNQSLIPQAYEAANAITDEKAKAQALLDIVNEINYFTQHQG